MCKCGRIRRSCVMCDSCSMTNLRAGKAWRAPRTEETVETNSSNVVPMDVDALHREGGKGKKGIFGARSTSIPNDRAQIILSFVQPSLRDLTWTVGLDEFEELLASKRESAPGPDGSPNSVYRSAGGIGAKFLFATYLATLQGKALPVGSGASRIVFIPKTSEANAQGLLIRSPESLRPLTLCNCDCKILAAAMCSGLQRYRMHPPVRKVCDPAHHDRQHL